MSKPEHLQQAHRNLARVMSNEQQIREEAKGAKHKKRQLDREKLNEHIEAYLAKGGSIKVMDSGQDLPSMAAMTGQGF